MGENRAHREPRLGAGGGAESPETDSAQEESGDLAFVGHGPKLLPHQCPHHFLVFGSQLPVFTFLKVQHIQKDFLLLCKPPNNDSPPQGRVGVSERVSEERTDAPAQGFVHHPLSLQRPCEAQTALNPAL